MIHTLLTFDGKEFELTDEQWLRLKDVLIGTEQTHIFIGDSVIHRSAIKDVIPNYERRDEVAKEKLEAKHEGLLPEGEIGKYLMSGRVEQITPDKNLRLKFKRMYYEHVKRRPLINEQMLPLRKEAWDDQQSRLPKEQRREKPALGFDPGYDEQEKYIIATPIEQLMEDYEKSIS